MDRKRTRAFEGFVAQSGDALLRMATLVTSDANLAEDVYQETLHRLAELAAWPTDPAKLRALLLAQAGSRTPRPSGTSSRSSAGCRPSSGRR